MQNSDFWSRITSLYGSLTSPVVLCMQNSVISIRITGGPSPQLWLLDAKQRLYGFQPSHVVLCIQNQRLLEGNNKSLWVPDITCRFVCAKQRDLHQNDKSIWVPALICAFFFMQSSDFRTRLTSLYLSQPSSVVFSSKTATFRPASKSLLVPDLTCQCVRTKQRDQHQNY